MKLDVGFFLGLLYTGFGGVLLVAWIAHRDALNLYGALMFPIGVALVALRPKPPLRFFVGRVSPEERMHTGDSPDDMGM